MGGSAQMIGGGLHTLDQDITLALNGLHFAAGDHAWQLFSNVKVWIPLYIIILVYLFRKLGWKKGLIVLLSVVLTVVACDQLGNLVKNAVERLRPCYDARMVDSGLRILEKRGGFFGFYSAHAANAFGLAMCSCMGLRNDYKGSHRAYVSWIFVWATLVSISRVFVGKHYFGDILAGALVGIIIGYILSLIAREAIHRL